MVADLRHFVFLLLRLKLRKCENTKGQRILTLSRILAFWRQRSENTTWRKSMVADFVHFARCFIGSDNTTYIVIDFCPVVWRASLVTERQDENPTTRRLAFCRAVASDNTTHKSVPNQQTYKSATIITCLNGRRRSQHCVARSR
jgi:hypothetical protein